MKTITITLACSVLATVGAWAQGATVVTAPELTRMDTNLTQLLEEARLQNEKLENQLKRLGDPAAVNLESVEMIKKDMLDSAANLKTKEQQRDAMRNITGAEAFTDDALGVMAPIGAQMTRDDGVQVDRDPERYRMESAVMEQIREFRDVREKALERKKALTDEISAVVDDLEAAKDLATIQKLNGMIVILRGQIEECNQTILIAQADAEMTQKELVNTAQIVAKGKQEAARIKSQTTDPNAPPREPTSAGPFGGVPEGGTARRMIPNLTWGRRENSPP